MLMIVNNNAEYVARRRFDEATAPRLAAALGLDFEIRHLVLAEPLDPGPGHTAMVLSGSGLSAAESNPRDDELMASIRAFADRGLPIFGICYGHQMVARALGGKCRKAAIPEFGWKRVDTEPDEIFLGLHQPVTLHSHYDEVYDLPADFRVIARTADCEVQAFRVEGRPIWGVQFHPEMDHVEGQAMLDDNLKTEPLAPSLYVDELESPAQADANLRLFENFARALAPTAATP
ncbi:MAG: type 1 glutamine amidotransferase [Acidobacteriota bacterium]